MKYNSEFDLNIYIYIYIFIERKHIYVYVYLICVYILIMLRNTWRRKLFVWKYTTQCNLGENYLRLTGPIS